MASRRRPTASARRERVGGQHVHEETPQPVPTPVQARSYPGGPEDLSLLGSYESHVAYDIWNGVDRGELKIVTHGRKVIDGPQLPEEVSNLISHTGLDTLRLCTYALGDKGIVSAFVERWHKETSSFHMPFGEMTITLDDVASLLHLPTNGIIWTDPGFDRDGCYTLLTELLGVTPANAYAEMEATRGLHVRLNWLLDMYEERVQEKNWQAATRAYLLFLVGCTIFADKSATYVNIAFLDLFRDLSTCHGYAWGVAALAFLYDYLGEASKAETKQMGGYLSLLQVWIYEHFPNIGLRYDTKERRETVPRAMKWRPKRGDGRVMPIRSALDALTTDDVIWTPYDSHRGVVPLSDISFFSGYIMWDRVRVPHLPERVLRQLGHVQGIPRCPPEVPADPGQIVDMWTHYADHIIDIQTRGRVVTHPHETEEGYVAWYRRVSHPLLIPPMEDEARCDQIADICEEAMVAHPDIDYFRQIYSIARGAPFERTYERRRRRRGDRSTQ